MAGRHSEGGRTSPEPAQHRAVSAVIRDLPMIIADGSQRGARAADIAGYGGFQVPFRTAAVVRLGVVAVERYTDDAGYVPTHSGVVPGAGRGHVGPPAMKSDVGHRILAIMPGGNVDHGGQVPVEGPVVPA